MAKLQTFLLKDFITGKFFRNEDDYSEKLKFRTVFIFYLIAVLFFFKIHFGFTILIPTNIHWLMNYDWGQHFLGWHFYRQEPWHFPLGDIQNFFYPLGTNIAYTDSIPLFAIPFKLIQSFLPANFQYQGIWFALCWILQAYYTAKVVRTFGKNIIAQMIGGLFLVFSPVMIHRSGHEALCAHWLLIATLYNFICLARQSKTHKALLKSQTMLLFLSALIHPYLTVMIFPLSLALLVQIRINIADFNNKALLSYLAVFLLLVLLPWYLIGYITLSGGLDSMSVSGYGDYTFNLNGFYNTRPQYQGILPAFKLFSEKQNHEGYSYLGLGMLLASGLSVATIAYRFKHIKAKLKKILLASFPLIVVVLLLSLFAISNNITFHDKLLLYFDLPAWFMKIANIFRASGRFIWVLYYIVVIVSLYVIIKKISKKAAIASLLIFFLVQAIDVKPLLWTWKYEVKEYNTEYADVRKLDSLFRPFEKIYFFPPFGTSLNFENDYIPFCYVAASNHKKINFGNISRYDNKRADELRNELETEILTKSIDNQTLYITNNDNFNRIFLKNLIYKRATALKMNRYFFVFSVNSVLAKNTESLVREIYPAEMIEYFGPNYTMAVIHDFNVEEIDSNFINKLGEYNPEAKNNCKKGRWFALFNNNRMIYNTNYTSDAGLIIKKGSNYNGWEAVKNVAIEIDESKNEENSLNIGDENIIPLKNSGINFIILDPSFNPVEKYCLDIKNQRFKYHLPEI